MDQRQGIEFSGPIGIIGAGYVGLVTGVGFAELGNDVICIDSDEKKIEDLQHGKVSFYEPGLEELLQKNISEKRIRFTADIRQGIQECNILFICVGTPVLSDGAVDLAAFEDVVRKIGELASSDKVIIEKSTVPVNTSQRIRELLEETGHSKGIRFSVVSNPEFLREGSALQHFFHPDRVVIGFEPREPHRDAVLALYKTLDAPTLTTDISSAELIKQASNAFLACKISFINLISRVCEAMGADVKEVARGMGMDPRIGSSFLGAGIGYGGSCLPKDARMLLNILVKNGIQTDLLQAIESVNERQKDVFVAHIQDALGDIQGKTIAVLGLSFKPDTGDMREAPSVSILERLREQGAALIKAYDPKAMEHAKILFPDSVEFCNNPYEAATGADALLILTEWSEFKDLDLEQLKTLLKKPIVIDGRNVFDPQKMRELGFTYIGIGRGVHE